MGIIRLITRGLCVLQYHIDYSLVDVVGPLDMGGLTRDNSCTAGWLLHFCGLRQGRLWRFCVLRIWRFRESQQLLVESLRLFT